MKIAKFLNGTKKSAFSESSFRPSIRARQFLMGDAARSGLSNCVFRSSVRRKDGALEAIRISKISKIWQSPGQIYTGSSGILEKKVFFLDKSRFFDNFSVVSF